MIGDNKCGIFGVECCENGFEAKAGWDPVSGVGTPKCVLFLPLSARCLDLTVLLRFREISNLLLNPRNPWPWANGVGAVEAKPAGVAALASHGYQLLVCVCICVLGCVFIVLCGRR